MHTYIKGADVTLHCYHRHRHCHHHHRPRRHRHRVVIIIVVGNAETWRKSIRENHPSRARTHTKWRACNSVTPVRDQTVGRRAAYLYILRACRPVERRRSCRVVSHREEPKARSLFFSLSLSLSSVRPRRQLHLPRAATRWPCLATWDIAAEGDRSRRFPLPTEPGSRIPTFACGLQ